MQIEWLATTFPVLPVSEVVLVACQGVDARANNPSGLEPAVAVVAQLASYDSFGDGKAKKDTLVSHERQPELHCDEQGYFILKSCLSVSSPKEQNR